MITKLKIKKGDTVTVITGADKGKSGKVARVLPKLNAVIVEGVGKRIKHQKPRRAGQSGQIVEKFHPIHVSNVAKKK
jgi:large subunit ribosomal protein L24